MSIMHRLSSLFKEQSLDYSKEDSIHQPFLESELEPNTSKEIKSSWVLKTRHVTIAATALFTAAILVIFAAIYGHSNIQTQPLASTVPNQILDCGTSAQEARAKGCVFDVMDYSWTPTPCFNETLSKEYWNGLVSNGIQFWKDSSKSEVLPHDEILAAKHEFSWTSWLLHLKHCQYHIHRELQRLTFNTPIDNVSRNLSHSEHCLEEIRNPSDVKTMLFTGTAYMKCAPHWFGDLGAPYWNNPS